MRPAGMSSDEDDFEDNYYSETLRRDVPDNRTCLAELIPSDVDSELKNYLDASEKVYLFHRAVDESNFQLMDKLVAEGISVDETKLNEWTPLMKACSHGNYEIVRYLLEHGANPNLHKELFTPLMACCIASHEPEMDKVICVRLLIQNGACVNARDRHKSTALISAASNGMKEIVNELLNVPDIDVNAQDKDGWTALFYAIRYNHKSIVPLLVNAGADVNCKTYCNNLTAFEIAELKGYTHFLNILRTEDSKFKSETKSKILSNEDLLKEFLDELPDQYGRGGFYKEVRNIFMGLGYEKMYDRLNINVSLPDFLVMGDNLDKLGIRTSQQRHKIALHGIHRYHLQPWSKESLHEIKDNSDLGLQQFISFISNITKHLSILYATLDYIRIRVLKRSKCDISVNKELINILFCSYLEIEKMNIILGNISKQVNKIKPAGSAEADFVDGKYLKDSNTKRKLTNYFWIAICTITAGSACFYYKY